MTLLPLLIRRALSNISSLLLILFYLLLSFLEVLDKRSHGYFKNSDVLNTSFTYFITSFYWYFTSFMNEYLKQINYSYYRDTRMREFLLKDITVDKIGKCS